jgi:ATP phosphoribosyltransferase
LHVGLELNEAVAYEQDILNSKIALIRAGQKLKNYKALRKEELEKRMELKHLARSVDVAMKILQDNLPKVKSLCEKPKKHKPQKPNAKFIASKLMSELKPVSEVKEIKPKLSPMELELLDIKKKLSHLQG